MLAGFGLATRRSRPAVGLCLIVIYQEGAPADSRTDSRVWALMGLVWRRSTRAGRSPLPCCSGFRRRVRRFPRRGLRGMSSDVYFQIGLLVVVGLAAKNAILIVEFASQLRAEGRSIRMRDRGGP